MNHNEILIHPTTKQAVGNFLKRPSHALVLIAHEGAGKLTLADYIASSILDIQIHELSTSVFYQCIEKPRDKQDIQVQQVHELLQGLSLKTVGSNQWRVIVIKDAHNMNSEAQNMLLKALEEPPERTLFILTINREQGILPTVLSRTQKITVLPIPHEMILKHFSQTHSDSEIERAYKLSQGLAGLMSDILGGQQNSLTEAIFDAKKILAASKFERLIIVEQLRKQKNELGALLTALLKAAQALHEAAVVKQDQHAIQHWTKSRRKLLEAQDALSQNAQTKLVLTDLFMSI